ncbi:hypothetical protein [Thiorhodococcus minor]|uniref:Uncharacterized protein n=1 Tax=Thiorhodococcus minor TaxID=57489 RepID=A0A6M0K4P6_9GAMM|nr:hypothetical protein [Thiorhodococcus minor]NEV64389.1 hypothetical protein [Thiorhodococcus minor]
MNDEILDEVRAIREAHAKAFDFDLDAIYADIQQREIEHQARGARFIDPPTTSPQMRSRYQGIRFGRRPSQESRVDQKYSG